MFWTTVHSFIWGIFGFCGILIPILMIYIAYQSGKTDIPYRMNLRFFIAISIAVLLQPLYIFSLTEKLKEMFFRNG